MNYKAFAKVNTALSAVVCCGLFALLLWAAMWRDMTGVIVLLFLLLAVIMSVVAARRVASHDGQVPLMWKILSFGTVAVLFLGLTGGSIEDSPLAFALYIIGALLQNVLPI